VRGKGVKPRCMDVGKRGL